MSLSTDALEVLGRCVHRGDRRSGYGAPVVGVVGYALWTRRSDAFGGVTGFGRVRAEPTTPRRPFVPEAVPVCGDAVLFRS